MSKFVFYLFALLVSAGVYAQPSGDLPDGEQPSDSTPDGGGGSDSSGASTTYSFESGINGLWQYDSDVDVYYIVGLFYCSEPADETYEQMGIFVPGKYMTATASSDSTYSCTIDTTATVNGYSSTTAPIVIPVNTSGYSAQSAPSGYSSDITSFTDEGFIYLWPGCRGRTHGAPLGVTDLKAAVRYFRYLQAEQDAVPGNIDRIFSFGHSGGGAQSAIFGASGNCSLYNDYLNAIGAESNYADNIQGSMCWCPITNLDQGDEAYEWNMGLTRSDIATADSSISVGLAAEFATYINAIGFKNPSTGETLSLSSTTDGYYQKGSYYEYVMEVINDAVSRYNSYNDATISSYSTTDTTALYSFASTYKSATKGLGAFDDYDEKGQAENTLFGIAGTAGHFDEYLANLVNKYATDYAADFTSDLASTNVDSVGKSVKERLMIYTPLYYLVDNSTYYDGGGSGCSDVAPYWRIRTGIEQGDAPLNTEINLALALQNYNGVESVDFETIWGQGHTQAEDSGDADDNFIAWVEELCSTETTTAIKSSAKTTDAINAYSYGKVIHINGDLEGYSADIININGTIVKNYKLSGSGQTTLEGSSLNDGIYFLRLRNNSKQLTFKLMLKNAL